MKHIHILNIEDSEKDSDLILLALKRGGLDVEWKRVNTPDALVAELENGEWDLIISDYAMPGYTGLEALEVLRTAELDIPLILVSGAADPEIAVLAMRRGASDYLMKNELARLVPAVTRELNEAANRREKREAQKALAESEERLKLALAAAGMGAWEWDLLTNDVFWSPECSTILGIPVAGTQIAQVLNLIVEEDREIADEKIRQAITSGSALSLRVRINRRGNEIVWIAINGKCESDDKGVFVRMVGTLRDITRDKKAEDALIDAEERYRVVAETASDAIISINEKSSIIFANPAAETIFGYSYAEMIGSELTMLMPDSLKGRHLRGFNHYLQTGKKHLDWHNVEVTARRKDGSNIFVHISFGEYKTKGRHTFTGIIRDITEKKRAENTVRESEEDFRKLIEATTQIVWKLDKNGDVKESPEWWMGITGQSVEKSKNYGWLDLIHPEERERVKNRYLATVESQTQFSDTFRMRAIDGGYRHFAGRSVPVVNADGTFRHFICTLTDITERKEAEERVRSSEARFRSMFEQAAVGVGAVDLSGKWLLANNRLCEIVGYTEAELQNLTYKELTHPDDRDLDNLFMERVRAGEISQFSFEKRYIHKNSSPIWVNLSAAAVFNAAGEIEYFMSIIEDITARKAAEKKQLDSETRLRTILETEPECVKLLDRNGMVLEMNGAGLDMIEADSLEQVAGHEVSDLIAPEYRAAFADLNAKVFRGESGTLSFEIIGLKGTRRFLETHAVPLRDSAGEITALLGVTRDITARRKAETFLIESQRQYAALINTIEGIVWEADAVTFNFNFVSQQVKAILGYTPEQWYEPGFWVSHIYKDDRDWALDYCAQCVADKVPHNFEYRMVAADGRIVWLRDIVSVVVEDDKPKVLRGIMVDVTERRKSDAAMTQQALIIEQAFEAIFVWDFEKGIIEWNKGCERLYGYTREEALGKFGYDILQSTFPLGREAFLSKLENDRLWSGEVTQITKDGRTVFADSRLQMIDYEGRQIVLQTNRDITDSKKIEQALRQSETRYRHLFENNPYPMWVYDVDTLDFLAVNDAACFRYGYTYEEFLSMKISDIRPAEDVSALLEKAESTKLRIDTSGNWRHKKKDGTIVNVEITSHALEFEGRKSRLVLANDITDRLKAEVAVKLSEEKYRDLFENANDLIYTHDLEGNFTSLNRAGERITGYTESEAKKINVSQVVAPEFIKLAKSMTSTKVGGGAPTIYELEMVTKDGRRVAIEVNTRLIFHDGKPIGVQGIGRDVSERRLAETALRESQAQLQQAQKLESIGILAGGMAHDFNNMLTAINGYSDLILRKIAEDDPIRKNILEIRKAGGRSAELTRQLLAFSRRQILVPKVLDVNQIIAETSDMLKLLIGEDIQITTRLDANLGVVEADPGQLTQILMNLVVNSRDAMPNGGSIVIETENVELDETYASRHLAVEAGSYVMLAVSDSGTGMDENTRQRIFEPFFTTKAVGRGTGLGLSTVYGIVKQSGGNIWVYSEPGKGTTFKIYLPRVRNRDTAPETGIDLRISLRGNETILLVEDEETVRQLSREILETCGYTVLEAGNGVEAMELCTGSNLEIDLLMTDIVMPQMGGRELAEKLSALRPAIKILFTSGYTDDAILRHGIIDEGNNFLQKPFTFDALSKKVRTLLDK